ncbi:MAG: regulatory protein RecX [Deltaproteobacteria bacterium]|nr:regulatory protein RecX [Deltaproteobacteria bacterium]MBW2674302.1 regulatory protein RecX [Deltaproteobacteria bacterium]
MDDPLYEKAQKKALRYLAYRGRSVAEVRSKLAEKGFDEAVIKKVIDRFCDLGYLDDGNFAGQWAKSLAIHRLWGDRKIEASLREKGISIDLIAEAIAGAREEKGQRCAIQDLVEKRLRSEPACEVFSYKGKRRLTQTLAGRGFPVGLILDVLREMGDACDDGISAGHGGDKGDIR